MGRLEDIRSRLEKATPGPWATYFATGEGPAIITFTEDDKGRRIYKDMVLPLMPRKEQDWNNATLIAHAPSDLRFLLAERDRLAAEVEAARDSLAAIADEPGCCADIADAKAFAREALARLGGGK